MALRWSEEEYQRWVQMWTAPGQMPSLTEAGWLAVVRTLAKQHGYLYYHTFDSRRSPSGFVDCVLAKAGSPLLMVELKTDAGQLTLAQQAWLEALAGCTGVVAEVWKPSMLDSIVAQLRR